MTPALLARLRDVAVVLFAVVAAIVHFVQFRDYVFEDAYITYRYADNLASGLGFAFNPGERVLGTSTPLYTLLLAALEVLGAAPPLAGALLYAAGLGAVALAGAWILRRHGHGNLAAVYAVAVLWGLGDSLKYFGMETALYAALLFATVIAALRERRTLTGVLLGLAFLTRYDAFVLTVALFVVLVAAERRIPWRTYLAAAAVVTPWLVFAFVYFGSVLPNTLAAKSRHMPLDEYMAGSLGRIADSLLIPFERLVGPLPPAAAWIVAGVLLAPVPFQVARQARRDARLALLVAFPVLLWLGYSLIGPPLAHEWYFLPGIYFLAAAGLLAWGDALGDRIRGRWPPVLALLLTVAGALALPAAVAAEHERKMGSVVYLRRVEAYDLLARFIVRHGLQDLRLVTFEPGYLAYRTKIPVVDAAGLVTRDIPREGSNRERLEAVVDTHRPDLVIASGAVLRRLRWSYRPLYHTAVKSLYVEEAVYREHVDDWARSWLAGGFEADGAGAITLPIRFASSRLPEGWIAVHGRHAAVGRPRPLTFRGERVAGAYLHTLADNVIASPPIRLDFDALTFRVNAPRRAVVELVVGGQIVLAFDGRDGMGDALEEVTWPVHGWRGRTAMLRLFDASHDYLALTGLTSRRYGHRRVLDDFESRTYGELWEEGFAERPCSFLTLARHHGLAVVLGRATAASLCRRGARRLVSRPFTIDHDRLAMTVLDFGGERARVELRSSGEVVHRFTGTRSRRPVGVIWDVSSLRGQKAVLAAIDDDPRLGRGVGIDDVVLFDWED